MISLQYVFFLILLFFTIVVFYQWPVFMRLKSDQDHTKQTVGIYVGSVAAVALLVYMSPFLNKLFSQVRMLSLVVYTAAMFALFGYVPARLRANFPVVFVYLPMVIAGFLLYRALTDSPSIPELVFPSKIVVVLCFLALLGLFSV